MPRPGHVFWVWSAPLLCLGSLLSGNHLWQDVDGARSCKRPASHPLRPQWLHSNLATRFPSQKWEERHVSPSQLPSKPVSEWKSERQGHVCERTTAMKAVFRQGSQVSAGFSYADQQPFRWGLLKAQHRGPVPPDTRSHKEKIVQHEMECFSPTSLGLI